MKPDLDADLMLHADGELDETTARELDERIGRDVTARGKLDAIGELGELVRGHIELSTDAVPEARFAGLWREIDKRIDHASEPEPAPAAASSDGLWRRMTRWFDRYRGHIITGAVSAGAVAALALVLRGPSSDPGSTEPGHGPIKVAPVVFRPSEIESLDTPGGTGTVFNLQDEDGSTTVIWVTPEDTVEGI